MSYTCAFCREVIQGKPKILLPSIVRQVRYNNYEISMKGNKLFKQYTGTSSGYEMVKEVSVCDEHIVAWKERYPVIVESEPKNIRVEYSRYPIREEDKQRAIQNDRVVVIDSLPVKPGEKSSTWTDEDYIGFEDEPSDKYE